MSIELAQKRALKFFEYHNLTLPVNVEKLLKLYATVEETYIPIEGDAICINKSEKPHIIIKSNMSRYRKRFTYAHELAHIQIPSHTGMISCTTELSENIDRDAYYLLEQEANSFAAELLMPSQWLKSLFNRIEKFSDLINTVCRNSEVSFMAALYNAIPVAPQNYLFIIDNKIDKYSHMKQGSNIYKPLLLTLDDNFTYDQDWLDINCTHFEEIDNDSMNVMIFKFKKVYDIDDVIKLSESFTSKESCKKISDNIVRSKSISFAHLFSALEKYMPDGYVLKFKCNRSGIFKYIYAQGTYTRPKIYEEYSLDEWFTNNSFFHTISYGIDINLDIWYFNTSFDYQEDLCDERDSKTILREIVEYYYTDKKERSSIYGRVNGIIGSLNSTGNFYAEREFYNILKQKFLARDDLNLLTNSSDFDQYLIKKTREIYEKKI